MIFIEKKITINNNQCKIDSPVVLYRGDYNVEVRFTIVSSPYKYSNKQETNVIEQTEASYGQLVIKTPNNNAPIFSEITATKRGAITFTITAEMIDEISEVGDYTFQIRLLDENKESRATIPEVKNSIEIREPIATEDVTDTNEVDLATAGYAVTTAGETLDAFDENGNYNKTTWATGDRITAAKLDKIEAGIDGVNKKVASGGTGSQGMTEEQAQQLSTAYQHSQSAHVQASDIPTKTSDLNNDSNFVNETYVTNAINNAQLGGGSGGTGSNNASDISIADTGNYFTSTNVEGALQEAASQIKEKANKNEVRLKNENITLNDCDTDMLSAIQGGGIPRDKSVTPIKTTFIEEAVKNKFDGSYISGYYLSRVNDTSGHLLSMKCKFANNDKYRMAIVPILSNETYTISFPDKDIKRLRIGIINSEFKDLMNGSAESSIDTPVFSDETNGSNTATTYTFTNTSVGKYVLIYPSNDSTEPRLQVELGASKTNYEPYYLELKNDINSSRFLNLSKELENKYRFIGNKDYEFEIGGILNANGRLETSVSRIRNKEFIEVYEGDSIYLTENGVLNGYDYAIYYYSGKSTSSFIRVGARTAKPTVIDGHYYIKITVGIEGISDLTNYVESLNDFVKFDLPSKYNLVDLHEQINNYVNNGFDYINVPNTLYEQVGTNTISNFSTITSQEYYDNLNSFVQGYSTYCTINELGGDAVGNKIYGYRFKPVEFNTDKNFKNFKVLITASAHGTERSPALSIYDFCKQLCERWEQDDVLEFIRFNVDLYIIPIVNPSGWNNKTYYNSNGVNINRNYPANWKETTYESGSTEYSGPSAASEIETQIVMNVMNTFKPNLVIDFHNMYFRDGYISFVNTLNEEFGNVGNRVIGSVGRNFKKRYDWMPQDDDHKWGYAGSPTNGTFGRYACQIGIPGGTLEVIRGVNWKEGAVDFDEDCVRLGTSLLVNHMISMIKNISKS